MRNIAGDCGFDIVASLVQRLTRQTIHQIEIHIVEIFPGDLDCTAGLVVVVYSSQRFKMLGVKALDADGQAIDPRSMEIGEFLYLECSRVRLHRYLGEKFQRQQGPDSGEDGIYGLGAEQTGGAAAEKHADHFASPYLRQRRFKIANKRRHIFSLRHATALIANFMRVEVAVGAFFHAPWNMNVETE